MRDYDRRAAVQAQRAREGFCARFSRFFGKLGWHEIVAEPILPSSDSTLIFTNSAVVSFKPFLRGENVIQPPGHFVAQPCIRVQNLSRIDGGELYSDRLLSFRMVGLLVGVDGVIELVKVIKRYLSNEGFSEGVRLRVSSRDADLLESVLESDFELVLDDCSIEYYTWSFGDAALTGRGATFALPHQVDGYRDIGNLIAFERQGQLIGYGFGVGVEVTMSCQEERWWIGDFLPACAAMQPTSNAERSFLDLLNLTSELIVGGVAPGARGARHVAREAARRLSLAGESAGFDDAAVVALLEVDLLTRGVSDESARAACDKIFPRVSQVQRSVDLSFDCPSREIADGLGTRLDTELEDNNFQSDLLLIDIYDGAPLDSGHVSVTFRVEYVGSDDDARNSIRAVVRSFSLDGIRLRGSL